MTYRQRLERIKTVVREWTAAKTALDLLEQELKKNPSFGEPHGWSFADAKMLRERLDATYFIRIYAEFESALRDYWSSIMGRDSEPRMSDLLIALSGRLYSLSAEDAQIVEQSRKYRNNLLHEGDEQVEPIDLKLACGCFCRYVANLKSWPT